MKGGYLPIGGESFEKGEAKETGTKAPDEFYDGPGTKFDVKALQSFSPKDAKKPFKAFEKKFKAAKKKKPLPEGEMWEMGAKFTELKEFFTKEAAK
eukprot:UN4405